MLCLWEYGWVLEMVLVDLVKRAFAGFVVGMFVLFL
jgi:hypothetical protein